MGLVTTIVELRREISKVQRTRRGREAGFVRMVYTPGHRRIAPNAVADAVAKAYLGAEVDEDVIWEILQRTEHIRPYVYGKARGEEAREGPDDGRANVQVREEIMEATHVNARRDRVTR